MITDKHLEDLRKRIAKGEHPVLPYQLWQEWSSLRHRQSKTNPWKRMMIKIGLVDERGKPLPSYDWYRKTSNGYYQRVLNNK